MKPGERRGGTGPRGGPSGSGSNPRPARALRGVLDPDPLGRQLVADAVRRGEVAGGAGTDSVLPPGRCTRSSSLSATFRGRTRPGRERPARRPSPPGHGARPRGPGAEIVPPAPSSAVFTSRTSLQSEASGAGDVEVPVQCAPESGEVLAGAGGQVRRRRLGASAQSCTRRRKSRRRCTEAVASSRPSRVKLSSLR